MHRKPLCGSVLNSLTGVKLGLACRLQFRADEENGAPLSILSGFGLEPMCVLYYEVEQVCA